MGEVFRATDMKLGREVALKLLPAEFSADPDRLARFEREAKVPASLNHPGIAHLYGLEQVLLPGGATAHVLVMELVPGDPQVVEGVVRPARFERATYRFVARAGEGGDHHQDAPSTTKDGESREEDGEE